MANFKILLEGADCIEAKDPGSQCELFASVAGVDGKGGQSSASYPGANGGDGGDHWWNITEHQGPRIINATVWNAPMDPGETCTVGFGFVDAGNDSDANAAVNAAAQAIGAVAAHDNDDDPDQSSVDLGQIISGLAQLGAAIFTGGNKDKTRGVVTIKAKNNGGALSFAFVGSNNTAISTLSDGGLPGVAIHMPDGDFIVYLRFSIV